MTTWGAGRAAQESERARVLAKGVAKGHTTLLLADPGCDLVGRHVLIGRQVALVLYARGRYILLDRVTATYGYEHIKTMSLPMVARWRVAAWLRTVGMRRLAELVCEFGS